MTGRIAGITVIDVCRQLDIEPTKELTWSVGNRVRDYWESHYGALPEKDLREKTNGQGSHCFAVYPEFMRAVIEKIILLHVTESARQGDLFMHRPSPGDGGDSDQP